MFGRDKMCSYEKAMVLVDYAEKKGYANPLCCQDAHLTGQTLSPRHYELMVAVFKAYHTNGKGRALRKICFGWSDTWPGTCTPAENEEIIERACVDAGITRAPRQRR
jgi:hypothetical protein